MYGICMEQIVRMRETRYADIKTLLADSLPAAQAQLLTQRCVTVAHAIWSAGSSCIRRQQTPIDVHAPPMYVSRIHSVRNSAPSPGYESGLLLFNHLLSVYLLFNLIEERLHLRLRFFSLLSSGNLLMALQVLAPFFQLRSWRNVVFPLFLGFGRSSISKQN